nr:hypothetical protein [Tanacetum cinerariifolium]
MLAIKALGYKPKRRDKQPYKEVKFVKAEASPSENEPDFVFDSELTSILLNTLESKLQFREKLLQHMTNVKKSVAERTCHKRLYDKRVNKRQMQKQESKVDLGKALDVGLVVTKSNGTESGKRDSSSRSGNDADTNNAAEPMVEVQWTAECNIFAT